MTIIVGVDQSESAAKALLVAAKLASALEVPLHIVSAYGSVAVKEVQADGQKLELNHENLAKHIADQARQQALEHYPGLEVTSAPVEGSPGAALVRLADELDAEMVVVGNRRVQGISRILGSIASDVAGHASCDVHVAQTHR